MSRHNRERRRKPSPSRSTAGTASIINAIAATYPPAARSTMLANLSNLVDRGQCALCGAPIAHLGLFVSTQALQKRPLAPPGKVRHVHFGLCDGCAGIPGVMDQVDARIVASAALIGGDSGNN